jgi:hypothetical protein
MGKSLDEADIAGRFSLEGGFTHPVASLLSIDRRPTGVLGQIVEATQYVAGTRSLAYAMPTAWRSKLGANALPASGAFVYVGLLLFCPAKLRR